MSAHLEDELAAEVASLAHLVGGGRLRERETGDLGDAYGPLADQLDDAVEMRAIPADLRPQRLHLAPGRLRRLRAGGDECRASSGLQDGKRTLGHVAADGI